MLLSEVLEDSPKLLHGAGYLSVDVTHCRLQRRVLGDAAPLTTEDGPVHVIRPVGVLLPILAIGTRLGIVIVLIVVIVDGRFRQVSASLGLLGSRILGGLL